MDMNRSKRVFAVSMVALGGILPAPSAFAWQNDGGTCPFGTSDHYWPAGSKVVDICTNWGGLPLSTLPAEDREYADFVAASSSAYWMWYRDGSDDFHQWLNQTGGFCNSGWYDNGDERNRLGMEDPPISWDWGGGCESTDLGCTAWDHADCFGWGDNRILAADIAINERSEWDMVKQDTALRCVQGLGNSMENTMLHEVGHSYGLLHDNALIALMNTNKPRVRNCDTSAGFRDYPMPDDMGGYMEHHKGYSGSRYNVAGTPWYRNGSVAAISRPRPVVSSTATSATFTFSYTLHSFYPHDISQYTVSFFFLGWAVPSFNQATKQWTIPSPVAWSPYSSLEEDAGRSSAKRTRTMTVSRLDFPQVGYWRLWVVVDDDEEVTETYEGDNLFMTDVVVARTN